MLRAVQTEGIVKCSSPGTGRSRRRSQLALAGIALGGCHASSEGPESPPPPTEEAIAKFNIATGNLPYPIDLYFVPSAAAPLPDGTLNLPTVPWRNAAMQAALNSQDGWSTTSSLDTSFTLPLDSASIGASSVKIIKLWLNPSNKAPATSRQLPA